MPEKLTLNRVKRWEKFAKKKKTKYCILSIVMSTSMKLSTRKKNLKKHNLMTVPDTFLSFRGILLRAYTRNWPFGKSSIDIGGFLSRLLLVLLLFFTAITIFSLPIRLIISFYERTSFPKVFWFFWKKWS